MGRHKTIAIITARGGSKRIPKKNIKDFCGKPIITYSIEAAVQANIFDTVMVSTDDKEIAEIARKNGADVPFLRSAKNSGDYATTADVLREVLIEYKKFGNDFEYACCIYPTAPFVTKNKLKDAMEILIMGNDSTVMPVTKFSFPPQRGLHIREGKADFLYPECASARSQDLEEIYHDCGQFYCFRVKDFLESGKLIGESVRVIPVSELEVQDIDNESDWTLAEMKYRCMKSEL